MKFCPNCGMWLKIKLVKTDKDSFMALTCDKCGYFSKSVKEENVRMEEESEELGADKVVGDEASQIKDDADDHGGMPSLSQQRSRMVVRPDKKRRRAAHSVLSMHQVRLYLETVLLAGSVQGISLLLSPTDRWPVTPEFSGDTPSIPSSHMRFAILRMRGLGCPWQFMIRA